MTGIDRSFFLLREGMACAVSLCDLFTIMTDEKQLAILGDNSLIERK